MPDSWVVALCPLCGERRAYLPADIFRAGYRAGLNELREEGTMFDPENSRHRVLMNFMESRNGSQMTSDVQRL